jgi:hypothetical protein
MKRADDHQAIQPPYAKTQRTASAVGRLDVNNGMTNKNHAVSSLNKPLHSQLPEMHGAMEGSPLYTSHVEKRPAQLGRERGVNGRDLTRCRGCKLASMVPLLLLCLQDTAGCPAA